MLVVYLFLCQKHLHVASVMFCFVSFRAEAAHLFVIYKTVYENIVPCGERLDKNFKLSISGKKACEKQAFTQQCYFCLPIHA